MDSLREYIEPIKKKWVYHFIVSQKTSVIEKPEWYLNQTLKWIYEHIDIVEAEAKKASTNESQARQQFIKYMLELAHMRLSKDMTKLTTTINDSPHSEAILIHTYNEVIQFVKIIRQLLGDRYQNDLNDKQDLMAVFADQVLFERIDQVEWEYSKKNLREITSCDSRWEPVLEGDYVDHYKIPRCVDRFLLQIRSISERVDCFRQLDCKFRLIDLQVSLFNKLLSFMKKSEPLTASKNMISDILLFSDDSEINLSRLSRVLNGVNFLRLILKEKCFISPDVSDELDKELKSRLDKATKDYVTYFNGLIVKVINDYEQSGCDLQEFLDFIKPKLAKDIFELVRDEALKKDQTRHTETMFKGLSLGRE
uniref:RAD50-interacting protein 1 n=1 Tax=Aceria tosichella TaxID=561515 RepID=A0A6G1SGQ6_9ACAR